MQEPFIKHYSFFILHFSFFILHSKPRSRSSTDRMSDSGSDDSGSNPGGITFKSLIY